MSSIRVGACLSSAGFAVTHLKRRGNKDALIVSCCRLFFLKTVINLPTSRAARPWWIVTLRFCFFLKFIINLWPFVKNRNKKKSASCNCSNFWLPVGVWMINVRLFSFQCRVAGTHRALKRFNMCSSPVGLLQNPARRQKAAWLTAPMMHLCNCQNFILPNTPGWQHLVIRPVSS